jgi:hypothetical protein
MKVNKKIIWIIIISLTIVHTLMSDPHKVFLLAGQSNMVGTGNLMDLPEELKAEQPMVMIYTAGTAEHGWITLQPGVGASTGSFGPEVTFGRDMSLAFPGETIALIKVAWSGTSLAYDWCPPGAEGTLGHCYTEFIDHVWNALNTYPGGTETQIMGMCWMQGESDASNIYPASDYEENLTCFINDVRAEFSLPQMPFIIAMIDKTEVWPEYEIVRQAQVNVAQTLPNIGIFDTDAYPSDGSHYYSEGLLLMGEDFASAMLELVSGNVQPGNTLGDVNNNQNIDIIDALLVAQFYVSLNPPGFDAGNADVNKDGSITIVDALLIAQYYVGLINGF